MVKPHSNDIAQEAYAKLKHLKFLHKDIPDRLLLAGFIAEMLVLFRDAGMAYPEAKNAMAMALNEAATHPPKGSRRRAERTYSEDPFYYDPKPETKRSAYEQQYRQEHHHNPKYDEELLRKMAEMMGDKIDKEFFKQAYGTTKDGFRYEYYGPSGGFTAEDLGYKKSPPPPPPPQLKPWQKILGVSSPYSKESIKKAFRLLSLQFHPDNPETGNREKFQEIRLAYEHGMRSIGERP